MAIYCDKSKTYHQDYVSSTVFSYHQSHCKNQAMQLNRHSLNPFPVNAFGNANIRTIICHFDFQKLHRSSMSNYMVSYIEKKLQKPWLNQKTDRALCYGTDVRLCKQQIKDILFLKMFNQLINFLLLMTEIT